MIIIDNIKKRWSRQTTKRKKENELFEYLYGARFGLSSIIPFTKAHKKRKKAKKVYKTANARYKEIKKQINANKHNLKTICNEIKRFSMYDDEISEKSKLEEARDKTIAELNKLQAELSSDDIKRKLNKYGWALRKIWKRKEKDFYRWDQNEFDSLNFYIDDEYDEYDEYFDDEPDLEALDEMQPLNSAEHTPQNIYSNIDNTTWKKLEDLYDAMGADFFKNNSREEIMTAANMYVKPDINTSNYETFSRTSDANKSTRGKPENSATEDEQINIEIKNAKQRLENITHAFFEETLLLGYLSSDYDIIANEIDKIRMHYKNLSEEEKVAKIEEIRSTRR